MKDELKKIKYIAGLITESEYYGEAQEQAPVDLRALVQIVNDAKRSGKQIALDGQPIKGWAPPIGTFTTDAGRVSIKDVASGNVEMTIDGQPIELPLADTTPSIPRQQKPITQADRDKWNDRFGPGGGYDTPAGRYTGD